MKTTKQLLKRSLKKSLNKYKQHGVFNYTIILSTYINRYSFYEYAVDNVSVYIGSDFMIVWCTENSFDIYYQNDGNDGSFGHYIYYNFDVFEGNLTNNAEIDSWSFLISPHDRYEKRLYKFINKLNFNKIYKNPIYKKLISYRHVIRILLRIFI